MTFYLLCLSGSEADCWGGLERDWCGNGWPWKSIGW